MLTTHQEPEGEEPVIGNRAAGTCWPQPHENVHLYIHGKGYLILIFALVSKNFYHFKILNMEIFHTLLGQYLHV